MFGPDAVHVDDLETMLNEHRRLDELASRGIVGFFSPMERKEFEHFDVARELLEDASFAKAALGKLPVSDDEWERVMRDGDDLDDHDYSIWLLTRPEINESVGQAISAALTVLPGLLGAARAGIPLVPQRGLEQMFTIGLTNIVANRMAEVTVTQLLCRQVPFLDALSATAAVQLREQDDTWQAWQRELERLVLESAAKGGGDLGLTAEILDDALLRRVETIENSKNRESIVRRIFLESSVMDLVSAAVAVAVTGRPIAAVPSGVKALLSPAYRGTIRPTPSGADAVLLALRAQ